MYDGKSGRAKKEITVVHGQDRYLMKDDGWKDGFNHSIGGQLDGLGIRTIFGTKVEDAPKATGKLAEGKQTFRLSTGQTVSGEQPNLRLEACAWTPTLTAFLS